ncbi:Phage-related protein [Pediococcus damnosus]|uniref:Phage-related protein n=2 Tax=Pediococcus damnosus TaxID=51663 RepID=A0A143AXQ7_9LACO|nr:type II toxin-antitoxin system HicB family antitoxin [Pediococcus damnosus]AMV61053.1 Phage-related protein [Pediococcus damnosus]AMV63619.1 Phage-related protein [Pediococcus damnosus]AMV65413.1 Phage-related protein [Pediococcus damnosus]AMV66440.1 Phage-related protein [Pediococcus damnosus]AMV68742.1 Phage-related protein [Pediococcus damnosus]
MKYLYFAVLSATEDKTKMEVSFPDLRPHAATFGNDLPDALHMAHDALEGYLLTAEDFKEKLPTPTSYENLSISKGELLVPIEVDTTLAREREQNQIVKKTLTIPKYLNDLGNANKINFSATLTNALKEKLDV